VNFLAHESQHYADNKRFGDIPSWRLEYRAKLVELAYVNKTVAKVLDYFISSQGDDPADPHSYANKRVLKALEDRLGTASVADLYAVPVDRLHEAAVAALKADSVALDLERRAARKL
jgi:lipase chaperone LimK